jgi:hypothetical protein
MTSHHLGGQVLPYTHCFRVAVTIDGDSVTVTDVKRVAMRAPASAPGSPAEGQSGAWVEVRGRDDEVLYHRAVRTGHLDSVEVFEEDGTMRRVGTTRTHAKLDLLFPDLPGAAHVALFGTHDTARKHQPSTRLLRIETPELRRGGTAKTD